MDDGASPLGPRASPLGPRASPLGPRAAVPGLFERRGVTKVDLRGEPGDGRFTGAVARALGLALPQVPNTSTSGEAATALWLGPDEWLLVTATEAPASLAARLRAALAGLHVAVTDVSAGRTILRVTGPAAVDLLAKGCSLDLHPRVFGPGACAQTLLARIPVLLHRPGAADDVEVYVARSFTEHLRTWLADASLEFLAGVAPLSVPPAG